MSLQIPAQGCAAYIAQVWIVLADQVEKARGAKHGILHPHSDEP